MPGHKCHIDKYVIHKCHPSNLHAKGYKTPYVHNIVDMLWINGDFLGVNPNKWVVGMGCAYVKASGDVVSLARYTNWHELCMCIASGYHPHITCSLYEK